MHSEITYVNEEKKHLLPKDLKISEDGIIAWLNRRSIPSNRAFVGEILSSLNLDINDTKGIIDICMGLSLNDSFWVTSKDFNGKYSDYNLYENEFDEALCLLSYTGIRYRSNKFTTSPELTTNGSLRKAWRRLFDGLWLYKGGSFGFANAGYEPYSEFLAFQIAKKMGLNAVEYTLENWKGILASKCKLFTDIDTAYVPIGNIIASGNISDCIDFYKSLGDRFYEEFASMLVFDAVIYNTDRHFGNFGLLADNKTGEYIKPAPIFDNGYSLLSLAMKSDFDNLDSYLAGISNPYGKGYDYINLAKMVMGRKQKEQLKRIINFKFEESDICNLPSWRMRALEEIVQKRVRLLLTN